MVKEKKYISIFDGLRVIALLGVFFYHLMSIYVPSGYLGVVIFFMFAGFLSMQTIVSRTEKSSIKDGISKIFDKIAKLYPALLITVLATNIIMILNFKDLMASFPMSALSSIFSFNNYEQIIRNESYFEAMNSLKPLTHIWALSLEFQFYVLFYLFVFPFYKKKRENIFLVIFILLFGASIAYSIYLLTLDTNITRIYYGIDTRISTFLLGAICSIIYSKLKKNNNAFLSFIAYILLLAAVAAMFVNLGSSNGIIYGINIYSIIIGIILILFANESDGSVLNKILSAKIFSFIVKRSYIIYLIHYPIIIFANRVVAHMNVDLNIYFAAVIGATIVGSEIIYWLVRLVFSFAKRKTFSKVMLFLLATVTIAMPVAIKSLHIGEEAINELKVAMGETSEGSEVTETTEAVKTKYDGMAEVNAEIEQDKLDKYNYDQNDGKIADVMRRIREVNLHIGGDAKLDINEYLEFRDLKVTIIGDSMVECAYGSCTVYFPDSYINAEGNRQLNKAVSIFNEMKEKGELGEVIIVALGTNSSSDIDTDALETIYQNLDGRSMVIQTVAIPYLIEEQKRNNALRNFAETHDNCYLADWYGTMKTHKEYFMGDDTHPIGLGMDAYAQLLFKTCIRGIEWKKIDNAWHYFGSTKKDLFSVELDKPVGETVTFGEYHINSKDKKEPIEWIVIHKDEKTKTELLLSKYALDRKKYCNVYAATNWQSCDVRKWLNNEFYDMSFENVGAKFVVTSGLDNNKNPEYRTLQMNKTYDKVFLLSYDEFSDYVTEDFYKCAGTEYFKSLGGYVNEDGNCDWWLRTAGDSDNHVMNVSSDGKLIMKGDYGTTDDFGVRPVIKVSYE
ncbi:MAG: acyltransferase [Lachnospiraceae bacterium]|nr:acyltransferase [Lachnospiraceae bacterium]